MKISKHFFDVFEGDEYQVVVDRKASTEHRSYVFFHEQERTFRHFKTFDTYKDAYAFFLKVFLSANLHSMVTINEKHWSLVENEIHINVA